ncbi:MAG TPA: WecB/TagA/CpsF family glycosyltransferase [Blastocatellia bacterium]|nr:WecB/TagA/CpsF family glycosyltransferase [Blastocatellia bacterium]
MTAGDTATRGQTDTGTRRRGERESRVTIAGVAVDNLGFDETLERIDALAGEGGPHYMAVVNAAKIVGANRDEELLRVLHGADLVTADGMSVVWASRLLGRPLKERVTGIDLFEKLVGHAAARGLSVFFFGAREDSVRGVAELFGSRHSNLKIAGMRDGYFAESESERIAGEINRSGADLLFVALGSPAQEKWIAANIERSGVRFALGVGGSFDHLSGRARRAPRWMQRAGLEWLYRLLSEPRRLWRRYMVGNTLFIWLVVTQLLRRNTPKKQEGKG